MFKIKTTSSWDTSPDLPEPARGGITVTDEPIWGENTGRNSNGKMIGDIVAWKTTVQVTWPPMSFAKVHSLRSAITTAIQNHGEFFDIRYSDIESGSSASAVTKTVYVGNIPRTLYSLSSKVKLYDSITIDFIEQ